MSNIIHGLATALFLEGEAGVSGLDVDWMGDLFGSADYRKHLASVVAQRAIETAKSRM